ncbi:MAG TPA: GspH/FimT family pseudopilin [Longimicrobium sp.]
MNRAHLLRHRSGGYTLVELLTVIVIAGIIASIAVPRMSNFIRHLSSRSAMSQVVSDLTLARTQAVREGRTVSFRVITAGSYQVTLDQGANPIRTIKTVDISGSQKNVSLSPTGTSISFDPRGMLRPGSAAQLVVTRGGLTDSVSVSAVGRVYRGGN